MKSISTFLLTSLFLFLMAAALQAQTLSPATVTLKPSQTQLFSVKNSSLKYSWSLDPSSGTGTISSSGSYTAPATITSITTVTVNADSTGHPALAATITLMPNVSISVAPTWISMTNGQSAPFSATVTGASNTAYTWSTPTVGSITSGGVYTVPANLATSQNITVTATSVLDPTKSATATIALAPTIAVTVNPTTTTLGGGQSTALNGAVVGTTNTGITWSLSPQLGTITNGVYTAPSPVATAQTVTVTATSQAATSRTASATISLVPVTISVSPGTASVASGKSQTFTPTITGSSNIGV